MKNSKFVIDNGSKKDKTKGESQGLLDQAFNAASTASGLIIERVCSKLLIIIFYKFI